MRISSKLKLEPEFVPTKTKLQLHVTPQFIGTSSCTSFNSRSCEGNTDSHTTVHYLGRLTQCLGNVAELELTGQGNLFTANVESTDNQSPREFRVTNYSLGAGLSFFPTRDSSIKVNGRVISTDLGDAIYRTYQAGVEFNQDRWGTHFSLTHQGSLQDETPEFIPGSGTVTRAQLNQTLHFYLFQLALLVNLITNTTARTFLGLP